MLPVVPAPMAPPQQLILQCSRACPHLCESVVLAGGPEALLGLRDGQNGALALLALTALLEGLHPQRGAPGSSAAAQGAVSASAATDDAIRRLSGLLQLSGDNVPLGFIAAGAVAAYLRFYAQPTGELLLPLMIMPG